MKNVLVVEDDQDISKLITIHLTDLGCRVEVAGRGDLGYQRARESAFDLIVLDVMLPHMDGLQVCMKLRAADITSPILMLTAKSEEIDKVLGLETGADDYLTKPFSVREFIARVKAIFRRTHLNNSQSELQKPTLKFDELIINQEKRKISVSGNRVELTPKEYDLLQLLASSPGKSYSREDLLSLVWGYEFNGYEHTVNSHINRLRSKIEPDFSKPKYILTTWGIGYRFNDEITHEKINDL
ncbi:DNA-binding response regulator [Cytophagales bacterium WSM2-2]|nr:DNA-binding response regulator [Cytophagales bacterium WSM2-2]